MAEPRVSAPSGVAPMAEPPVAALSDVAPMGEPPVATLSDVAARTGRALRDAGLPSSPERSVRFARALLLAPPRTRRALYCTARTVFVSDHEQLGAFDAVFARLFDGLVDPADSRGQDPPMEGADAERRRAPAGARPLDGPQSEAGSRVSDQRNGGSDQAPERDAPVASAAGGERLAEKDFGALSPEELAAITVLMRALALAPPTRRTRRAQRDLRHGRLDLRATLRASHRTGGDPVRRLRRRRVERPRRLVVLCDISGSMEPYARAFLQFLHSAVGGADAEAFVFATRLTRITRSLRGRQAELALARAAAAAPDWSGGTQIGAALQRFNDEYGRRGMARGAVVVIVSDGWERGDPSLVEREMQRLARLAHRIVWVNPRSAAPGFAPQTGGMAAALPSCDALVSGHTLAALPTVIEAISGRPARPPAGGA
jgi:uncharacterized protein with von Willebrand factor type A (vWA) domain